MSLRGFEWIWPQPEEDFSPALQLASELKISSKLARLLLNRGISDARQARAFLAPGLEQLHSPFLMAGMTVAVERTLAGIERGEKITVHGDYDADGVSAAVILVEALRRGGADVNYLLPSRFEEGYGLHPEPLRKIKEQGTDLVITVDCGINAAAEVDFARSIGLDVIITDHHQPLENLAGPLAVINPLQESCAYPFKALSGAGIALKFAIAFMKKAGLVFPRDLFDLAALGTAADVVPLCGENRVIVAEGLAVLQRLERTGFRALAEALNLQPDKINSRSLSFVFAPAINAAGRMGDAGPAAELLMAADSCRAGELARDLVRANRERRLKEQQILKEAKEAANALLESGEQSLLTLAADNWHHGVIGIVASRLVEQYNRPVVMIALENGEGRGSARSIPGFDITAALHESASLLERFGGHDQAAGFTVKRENLARLREGLNRHAQKVLGPAAYRPAIRIETEPDDDDITCDFAESLETLQPFGTENPVPILGSRSWQIGSWRAVGADQSHLKLNLHKNGLELPAIFFSGATLAGQLEEGRSVDLAFNLRKGNFRDRQTLDLVVVDLAYADQVSRGAVTLVDRRECADRDRCLAQALLAGDPTGTVVFAATVARCKRIAGQSAACAGCSYLSTGRDSGTDRLPGDTTKVILYDLPLYAGLIKPFLTRGAGSGGVTFYLLYGAGDRALNSSLLALSWPGEDRLLIMMQYLKNISPGAPITEVTYKAAWPDGFRPGNTFYAKANQIFEEIGIVKAGSLTAGLTEALAGWPAVLDQSETYLGLKAQRAECEQFQNILLEKSPPELADYLGSLGG